MDISIKDILSYLEKSDFEYKFLGNENLIINKYSALSNVKNNSVTWIKDAKRYNKSIFDDVKNILVVSNEIENFVLSSKNLSFIFCKNPKEVFFSILKNFFEQEKYEDYIGVNSIVETKLIGNKIYIGHNCFIGKDVIISDNVIIKNNVSIEGRVVIGENSIIHSGVVIGSDGFGYFQNSEGRNIKVPHYGGVIIGKDVEIGANTCINKGTLEDTIIGDNVKIDSFCHIAHNVVVNENTVIVGKASIAGSTIIGKNSWIGPHSVISNGLTVGDGCHIGLGSVVLSNLEDNVKVFGNPARIYDRSEKYNKPKRKRDAPKTE